MVEVKNIGDTNVSVHGLNVREDTFNVGPNQEQVRTSAILESGDSLVIGSGFEDDWTSSTDKPHAYVGTNTPSDVKRAEYSLSIMDEKGWTVMDSVEWLSQVPFADRAAVGSYQRTASSTRKNSLGWEWCATTAPTWGADNGDCAQPAVVLEVSMWDLDPSDARAGAERFSCVADTLTLTEVKGELKGEAVCSFTDVPGEWVWDMQEETPGQLTLDFTFDLAANTATVASTPDATDSLAGHFFHGVVDGLELAVNVSGSDLTGEVINEVFGYPCFDDDICDKVTIEAKIEGVTP